MRILLPIPVRGQLRQAAESRFALAQCILGEPALRHRFMAHHHPGGAGPGKPVDAQQEPALLGGRVAGILERKVFVVSRDRGPDGRRDPRGLGRSCQRCPITDFQVIAALGDAIASDVAVRGGKFPPCPVCRNDGSVLVEHADMHRQCIDRGARKAIRFP